MTKPRSRAGERRVLHPDRLLRLWSRARWWQRIVALLLLLLSVWGLVLLFAPLTVRATHPEPPPFTVDLGCPPAVVSTFAGRGGVSTPLPHVEGFAALHDEVCAVQGRRRAVTGVLLAAAGLLNAAALLEIARLRRRAKRRRRRVARRVTRG